MADKEGVRYAERVIAKTCSCHSDYKSGAVYKSSYDTFGNVTSRTYSGTTATLSYDSLDRLVKWGSGSSTYEQYAYDASGNRSIQRTVSGGTTTITVYAFGLEEYQYSSSGTLTNATHYYTLGGKLIGALTGLTSPSTVMFLTDALGSLLATLSNTAGSAAIQGNQVYGPYGNQLYSSHTSMDTAKGYTGQYGDALSGLDYYISRYYDPVVGVFLSADVKEGNAQGLNPYAYVGGNPETYNDPSGQYYAPPGGGGGNGNPNPPSCTELHDCNSGNSSGYGSGSSGNNAGRGQHIGYTGQTVGIALQLFGAFYTELLETGGYQLVDQYMAYWLAMEIQWYRNVRQHDTRQGNYASGFVYITNAEGVVTAFGMLGYGQPQFGFGNNSYTHSEQQLLNTLWNSPDGKLPPILQQAQQCGLHPGYTFHVVIFSQLEPCPACGSALYLAQQRLIQSVPAGVNVDFTVWTSRNQTKPFVFTPGTVVTPHDVREVDLEDYVPIAGYTPYA